jgi:hypothetical protein
MFGTLILFSENLVSKKRHSEAARVLLDYSKDIREAVIALVQGNHFSEARRVVSMHFSGLLLIVNHNVPDDNDIESRTLGRYYLSVSSGKLCPDCGGYERMQRPAPKATQPAP